MRFFLLPARARGVHWWVEPSSTPSPYLNLLTVLRALRGQLGGWGLRGLLSQALVMLVYRRLGEVCRDMEGLAERFQAGRLWRVAGRRSVAGRVVAEERRALVPRLWPGRFGWLVRAASWQAAGYGSQLAHVLRQPEMIDLLLASPRAARILRPVCRMLAVEMALLRPRPEGAPPEVAPPPKAMAAKRVRKPRVPVDWGRIPLPRGVLSAARRQGFGKIR